MAAYFAAKYLIDRRRQRDIIVKKLIIDLQNPFFMEDDAFRKKFCLNKEAVQYIVQLVGPIMRRPQGYPIELQILASLQVLGSGNYQSQIGAEQILKVSQATISRSLDAFLEAILEVMPKIIEFPSPSELAFAEPKLYGQSKIPNIIGVVDCIHVLIQKPHVFNTNEYLNEKNEYSIKVQLVCDSDLNILDAVVEWPGCTANSIIWKDSSLRSILSDNNMMLNRNFLLGDNTFPLEPWLLVPYEDCQRSEELIFNDHVHRALTTAQMCAATLRKRFKCLHHDSVGLHYAPEKCCRMIMACLILHNIAMKFGVELDEPVDLNKDVYYIPYTEVAVDQEDTLIRHEGMGIRDDISKLIFY